MGFARPEVTEGCRRKIERIEMSGMRSRGATRPRRTN